MVLVSYLSIEWINLKQRKKLENSSTLGNKGIIENLKKKTEKNPEKLARKFCLRISYVTPGHDQCWPSARKNFTGRGETIGYFLKQ